MKRVLSFVLSLLMVLSCFTGITIMASAEEESNELVMTADDLATKSAGANTASVTFEKMSDEAGEFVRYTTTAGDPFVWYNSFAAQIGKYQYMEITYKTTATENVGAYFMNTSEYDFKEFEYNNDGNVNKVVVDLSKNTQWGPKAGQFRFDPQTAGTVGEFVDYYQVRFFNPTRVYFTAGDPNTKVFYDGGAIPAEGKLVLEPGVDFTVASMWIGIGGGDPITAWEYKINDGAWTKAACEIGAWSEDPTLWAAAMNGGGMPGVADADPYTNNVKNLVVPTGALAGGKYKLAVRCVTAGMEYAEWDYDLVIDDLATYTLGAGNTGTLFNNGTGASDFGVRFYAKNDVNMFTVQSLATYNGSGKSMTVDVYQWNIDYKKTTKGGEPLFEATLEHTTDNGDLVIELPEGISGDLLFVFTPAEGTFTGKGANEGIADGVEFFVGGNAVEGGFMCNYTSAAPQEFIYDFTKDGLCVQGDGVDGTDATFFGKAKRFGYKYYDEGFTKLYQTADGQAEDYMIGPNQNLNKAFKYAAIVYRTTSAAAKFEMFMNTASTAPDGRYGYEEGQMDRTGAWAVAYIDLNTANGINQVRLDFLDGGAKNDYVDIAYIGLFKSATGRAAYDFGIKYLSKDQYVYSVAESDAKIDLGKGGQGSPYTGATNKFGQQFKVDQNLVGIEITSMATYDDPATKGTFKIWKWDTDYATTTAAEPLFSKDIENHPNCITLDIDLSALNLTAGEYFYECQCTAGAGWTPWIANDGNADGVTAYLNGAASGAYRASVRVHGLIETNACIGNPLTMAPTYELDFSYYVEKTGKEYGFAGANTLDFSAKATEGYVTFKATGPDPYVSVNNKVPAIPTNLAAYGLIKYRSTADSVFQFFVNRTDGITMGNPGSNPSVAVEGGNVWKIAKIDLSDWSKVYGVNFTAFRIDPLANCPGEKIDISWIKFFANEEAADAAYDAEMHLEGSKGTVPAKDIKVITAPVAETEVAIDMNAVQTGSAARIEVGGWAAAGYTSTVYCLGYANYIALGEMDLSKYSKVIISYGSDGSDDPTGINYAAASDLAIGLKSTATSFGQVTDNNFDGAIAYTQMEFVNKGWATGQRDAVVDLSDIDYNGPVYVTVHNPAGTEIAIDGITFVTKAVDAVVEAVPDAENVVEIDGKYYIYDATTEYSFETPVTAEYTAAAGATSCDSVYQNGGEQVYDGPDAQNIFIQALGGVVDNTAYKFSDFAVRGWYGDGDLGEIEAYGYAIGDSDPVFSADFFQATEDAVRNAAGTEFAQRYCITIDVSKLEDGNYAFYPLVKHKNGEIRCLAKWGENVIKQGAQIGVEYEGLKELTLVVETLDAALDPELNVYFSYNDEQLVATTPAIPVNPADVKDFTVFDGKELYSTAGAAGVAASEYNLEKAYLHLESNNGDPQYYLFNGTTYTLAPYFAVKYKTPSPKALEGFIGVGGGATGQGDHFSVTLNNDEEWHIATCYLPDTATKLVVDEETGLFEASYFRFDFLTGVGEIDIAWVGFFRTAEDADTFDKFIWTAPAYATVTFVDEAGAEVKAVEYRVGAETIAEPKVPAKDGFDGAWEAYKLDGTDVTVKPVYTEKAPEDTTAEDTSAEDKPLIENNKILNYWAEDKMKGVFTGGNQTAVSFSDEGVVLTFTGEEGNADPFITFVINSYYKKVNATPVEPAKANYVVFKIKATNCDGGFELFTAQPAGGDSGTATYEGNGEWEYIVVDMSMTTLVEAKKLSTMRIDWAAGGIKADGTMTIGEIAFFETEEEANAYAGIQPADTSKKPDDTKKPDADVTTAAPADDTTAAEEEKGCGSAIGFGIAAVLVSVLGLGYTVLKKKED